jgi:regulator of sigma E protease
MSLGLLILGLVLFIALVVVHEFGHFIVARRNGVGIEEFGIFFPPKLWGHKTKKGWLFTINLIPLGGFVRLKGEHDSDTRKGSFGAASLKAKTKIMLAGVTMNLLAAFVLLTVLAWVGLPQLVSNQYSVKSDSKITENVLFVGQIEKNSPAAKAGLQPTDSLLSIQSDTGTVYAINSTSNLPSITKKVAGQTVTIRYRRNKNVYSKQVALRSEQAVTTANNKPDCVKNGTNCEGVLGISPLPYTVQRSTWSAPVTAAGDMVQYTGLTFEGLGKAVSGLGGLIAGGITGNTAARQHGQTNATSEVSGPVGIFELLKTGSLLGYKFVLMIIAIISLSLAIMNVLPIPALDGGKLFVTLVARLFKKKLSENAEAAIYGSGFAILIILVILITIVDVRRYF